MNENEKEKLLKVVKPKIFDLVLFTLVSLGPLGKIDLIEGDTKKLGITITLSIVGLLFMVFCWNDHRKGLKLYKELQNHFQKK